MDAGRRRALEMFGEHGPHVRARLAEMVLSEHEASLDAQHASGHRSQSVYGHFWIGLLEKFEEFGRLPNASLQRPGRAPYRLPVVNDVALFPWRYGRSRESSLEQTPFTTSDARIAAAALPRPVLQPELDLGLEAPELTDEDRKVLETIRALTANLTNTKSSCRLVVVAVASSPRGLFSAHWGEALLTDAGTLEWVAAPDDLLVVTPSTAERQSATATFVDGDIPRKFPSTDAGESTSAPR